MGFSRLFWEGSERVLPVIGVDSGTICPRAPAKAAYRHLSGQMRLILAFLFLIGLNPTISKDLVNLSFLLISLDYFSGRYYPPWHISPPASGPAGRGRLFEGAAHFLKPERIR